MNVLLADKSEGANDRQSRNGAGKTSFIELVHFLFGADVRKENIFRSEALAPWTFDVTVDIAGETVSAARSGTKPSRILVNGAVESWPIAPQFDQRAGLFELSNENWKANLGHLWFGLPISAGDVDGDVEGPRCQRLRAENVLLAHIGSEQEMHQFDKAGLTCTVSRLSVVRTFALVGALEFDRGLVRRTRP